MSTVILMIHIQMMCLQHCTKCNKLDLNQEDWTLKCIEFGQHVFSFFSFFFLSKFYPDNEMSSFGCVSLLWGKVTMGCQKVESWCVYIIPTATIQWWIFMPNPGICFRYISIPTIAQSKALHRTNIIILCSKYWLRSMVSRRLEKSK